VKEKPSLVSPFVRTFPSDRVAKVTMDVNVHFFIHKIIPANSGDFLKLLLRLSVWLIVYCCFCNAVSWSRNTELCTYMEVLKPGKFVHY